MLAAELPPGPPSTLEFAKFRRASDAAHSDSRRGKACGFSTDGSTQRVRHAQDCTQRTRREVEGWRRAGRGSAPRRRSRRARAGSASTQAPYPRSQARSLTSRSLHMSPTLMKQPGAPAGDLEWSEPITADTVRRVACDCAMTRVLLGQTRSRSTSVAALAQSHRPSAER